MIALMEWGRRHRKAGIVAGTLLWVGLSSLLPLHERGVLLAFGPAAGVAAAAIGGAVLKGVGSALQARKTKGYRPPRANIRHYENLEFADVNRLHSADPWSGPGLGFNQAEMAAQAGPATSESVSELRADEGALERAVARRGMAATSGAYHRGKQRAVQAHLGRTSEIRRRNVLAQALQKRRDLYNRLGATQSAYQFGVSAYNRAPVRPSGWGILANTAGEALQGYAQSRTI